MAQGLNHTSVDPLWYKDAVIYELHVKTFCDSDGDGMGDFRGLIEKLDYVRELGVTAIWLLPFYPSPLRDDGYDIADYYSINPLFGTLKDFKVFLRAARGAIFTSGAIPRKSTARRASSSAISRLRIGHGTRLRTPSTGIGSTRI